MKPTKSVLNGKNINLTGDNTIITSNNFNVDKDGNMSCSNANVSGTIKSNNATITGGKIRVQGATSSQDILRVEKIDDSSVFSYVQPIGAGFVNGDYRIDIFNDGEYVDNSTMCLIDVFDSKGETIIRGREIKTPILTQTSLESQKKNFEKMQDNALEILKQIDIYKYNLKNEQDTDKKHIGFVIGDNYNYSKEVTSLDNEGVDNYAFTSLCCKAIQELTAKVEELENKIKEMEEK